MLQRNTVLWKFPTERRPWPWGSNVLVQPQERGDGPSALWTDARPCSPAADYQACGRDNAEASTYCGLQG